MKMIQNYLDNLESYLPDELKQDVRDELEASIMSQVEDSQEALGRELNLEETEALLRKLGHPMRVASAYLPKQQLIGPNFFPAYKKALKIALMIMVVVIVLISLLGVLSGQSLIDTVIDTLANVADKGLYVFAIVTLIFYLMEYCDTNLNEIYAWSPKDLKSKSKRLALSRIETGFEIIITVIFMAWWNDIPSWPAQALIDVQPVSVSLSPEWQAVFWSVNVIVGLSLALALYNFVVASWSRFSLAAEIILSLATLVIISQIGRFDQLLILHSPVNENAGWERIVDHLDYAVYSILAIIAVVCVFEIISNFRKISSI